MPNLTDTELIKSIRSGKIAPIYYFYGKDVATLESITKKLIAKLCPDRDNDMNYHFFSGGNFDMSQFADACEALPMFSDRILIAVNDLNAENLRTDDTKYLFELLSNIDSQTTTVIFYSTGVDIYGGKKTISTKNKKLADHISKVGGAVTEFAFKRPNELVKYIQSRCSDELCVIHPREAEYLASVCLCNVLAINNEIAKLTAYVGKGEITQEIIDELVSGQLDTDAYKLASAVVSGNSREVFKILPELYAKQAEPIPLMSVISASFIDLYRASLAYSTGRTQSDILEDYNYRGRDFVVRNAFRDCRKLSLDKLRACIGIMSQCDIDMKSKRVDSKLLLETAIMQMLALK